MSSINFGIGIPITIRQNALEGLRNRLALSENRISTFKTMGTVNIEQRDKELESIGRNNG